MAKAATETEKPAAPAADPEEEFEIVVPAEEQPLRLEDGEEAEPPKKPVETKKEPEKAKPEEDAAAKQAEADRAKAAETKAEQEKAALLSRAKEDRTKRKEYARRYEDVLGELDRARQELAKVRRTPEADGRQAAYWKQRVAELREEAEKSDSMGALAELTLNAFYQEQERRDRLIARRLADLEYVTGVAVAQVNARVRHPEYDQILKTSGVQDAIAVGADGNWKDPVIGRAVFFTRDGELRADPAERAWEIGEALLKGKDAYEKELAGEDEALQGTLAEKEKERTAAETPKAEAEKPKPNADTEVAAERRGAQRVIETVEANAKKPVGIRGIRSAGSPGRGVVTFAELDRMRDENPTEWARVLKDNPDLERRYMGG